MSTRLARMLSISIALLVPAFAPAEAQVPDWSALASEETVRVLTSDADGGTRETTVWLVVVAGEGFVRTGRTRWGANLERSPELVLRAGASEYPLRVVFVQEDALRQQVSAAFRAKYGWSDRLLSPFRGRRPRIMRLVPRVVVP